jgi:glycosyltransferase involved in cell wall biosynthesis
MRVAIVGDYPLDTAQIQGGVQAAFAYLVRGLSQIDGLQIHVLTLGSPDRLGFDRIERDGVTLHIIPVYPRFELARNYRTYQARLNAKLAQIQPDVVHAQDASNAAYVALRSAYPTVITVHGIWREDGKHRRSLYRRARNLLHSHMIERYNLRHTHHLIAISPYVVDYFASLLRPDARVYHVPNAIDQTYFDLADTSEGRTILYAGGVMLRKRALDLVYAFAQIAEQHPSAQLRIAGECSSEATYAESVQRLIRKENLEERVHLLGPLPEDAILGEFASCDILALPSAQETTPMVIAQAMAAGKPVVATPVGGVPEMMRDGETGFLVGVGDIDGLAAALLRLLRDPELRDEMGRAGREFAIEYYRADLVARRTHNVYREIAAGGVPVEGNETG